MVRAAETMTTGSESALILPHYRLSSSSCGPQSLVSEEVQPRRRYTALRGGASWSPAHCLGRRRCACAMRAGVGLRVAGGRVWTGGQGLWARKQPTAFIWIPAERSFLP